MLSSRFLTQSLVKSSARPLVSKRASQLMFSGFRRMLTTENTTPAESYKILEKQRTNRPLSPDLGVYKFPLSGILSGGHRITGVVLGLSAYAFFVGYAALPFVGFGFESSTLVNAFGSLPLAVKLPAKFILSVPFSFHFFNGLRHMFWDVTTANLSRAGLKKSNPIVLGLTAVASLVLTFL